MSSGYIPPKEEPDPDEILEGLRRAMDDNPRLAEMPEEELARQLVLGGYIEKEPSPPLVAEALQAIEADTTNLPREAVKLDEKDSGTYLCAVRDVIPT